MQDRNLKGQVIDQRTKDGRSVEVDGDARFCGHRFLLKTRLYGDKKCLYCGKWFHWKDTDWFTWIREGNIDRMNLDGVLEPLHCNSDHCREYHHLVLQAQEKNRKIEEEKKDRMFFSLFKNLKAQGVIN